MDIKNMEVQAEQECHEIQNQINLLYLLSQQELISQPQGYNSSLQGNRMNDICSLHSKRYKYFCSQDWQQLCRACMQSLHQGHVTIQLEEKINQMQQEINQSIQCFLQQIQLDQNIQKWIQLQNSLKLQQIEFLNLTADIRKLTQAIIDKICLQQSNQNVLKIKIRQKQAVNALMKLYKIKKIIEILYKTKKQSIEKCQYLKQQLECLIIYCNDNKEDLFYQDQDQIIDQEKISKINQKILISLIKELEVTAFSQQRDQQQVQIQEQNQIIQNLNLSLNQKISELQISEQQLKEKERQLQKKKQKKQDQLLKIKELSKLNEKMKQQIKELQSQISNLQNNKVLVQQENQALTNQIKILTTQNQQFILQTQRPQTYDIQQKEDQRNKTFNQFTTIPKILSNKNHNKAQKIKTYTRIFFNSSSVQSCHLSETAQESYKFSQETIFRLMPVSQNYTRSIQIQDNELILVGGYTLKTHSNHVIKILEDQLIQTNLVKQRRFTTLAYDNSNIVYIIGGIDSQDNAQTSKCEAYKRDSNQSVQIADYLYRVVDNGACYAFNMI